MVPHFAPLRENRVPTFRHFSVPFHTGCTTSPTRSSVWHSVFGRSADLSKTFCATVCKLRTQNGIVLYLVSPLRVVFGSSAFPLSFRSPGKIIFFLKSTLHLKKVVLYYIGIKKGHLPVAQLDSASDSDSEGRRFESCRVGQKTEHTPQGSVLRFLPYPPANLPPRLRGSRSSLPRKLVSEPLAARFTNRRLRRPAARSLSRPRRSGKRLPKPPILPGSKEGGNSRPPIRSSFFLCPARVGR